MRAAVEAAAVVVMLAALAVALREWLHGRGPRPAAQHAAPRGPITIEADRASSPPPGYDTEDTDTWLTRPAATAAYQQLAPDALDAAANAAPPWPATETPAERDAWVQASLAADQPLEQPALQPLPPLARQGTWTPRTVPPGRHCAPEPAAAEPLLEPGSDRDFVRSVIGDTEDDAERATELPLVAYAQLGGRTVEEYVDELFAGMVVTGA